MNKEVKAEVDLQKEAEALALLQQRAQAGDRSVLPELRRALDAHPEVWQGYGDLALHAEAALGVLAAGDNLLLGESLRRKLAALKEELGGESPTPLERLLVQRVVATWLQVNYYDGLAAQSAGAGEARSKVIMKQQDAANRRHLAALKVFATVRKLLTPPLSPVEIASRLDRNAASPSRFREGVAGTVGVLN